MTIGRRPLSVPRDQHRARPFRPVEPQQHIGKAENGAGRLAAAPQDRFRQGVIGAVRERIAVDHQQRPAALAAWAMRFACRFSRALSSAALAFRARLCFGSVLQHRPRPAHDRWRLPSRARRDRRRRRPDASRRWRSAADDRCASPHRAASGSACNPRTCTSARRDAARGSHPPSLDRECAKERARLCGCTSASLA